MNGCIGEPKAGHTGRPPDEKLSPETIRWVVERGRLPREAYRLFSLVPDEKGRLSASDKTVVQLFEKLYQSPLPGAESNPLYGAVLAAFLSVSAWISEQWRQQGYNEGDLGKAAVKAAQRVNEIMENPQRARQLLDEIMTELSSPSSPVEKQLAEAIMNTVGTMNGEGGKPPKPRDPGDTAVAESIQASGKNVIIEEGLPIEIENALENLLNVLGIIWDEKIKGHWGPILFDGKVTLSASSLEQPGLYSLTFSITEGRYKGRILNLDVYRRDRKIKLVRGSLILRKPIPLTRQTMLVDLKGPKGTKAYTETIGEIVEVILSEKKDEIGEEKP